MQTIHLFVFQVSIFLTVPRRYFFCGSFMFFCLVFAMHLCASVYICLMVHWEGADLLALICGVSLSHWCPGLGVVLDCMDS